jgi:hypothetical protein
MGQVKYRSQSGQDCPYNKEDICVCIINDTHVLSESDLKLLILLSHKFIIFYFINILRSLKDRYHSKWSKGC